MINQIDFYQDGVIDIDYSRKYNCKINGCRDICRCSIIIDIKFKYINVNKIIEIIYNKYFDNSILSKRDSKLSEILWNISDEINFYTIDRICRFFKIWENIEVIKKPGYYGEEIDSVKIKNSHKLEELINIGLSINDLNKRIEYLLVLEYGYLLPELEKRDWELSEININDIIIRNEYHLNKVLQKDLEHYSNINYNNIKGIIILTENNKWKLIDGYHRISQVNSGFIKVLKGVRNYK
jgi:hypothetical protein